MEGFACFVSAIVVVLFTTGGEGYTCTKPFLEVAVSPATNMIQVFWNKEDLEPGSWIGIYSEPPSMQDSHKNRLTHFDVTTKSGFFITNLDAKKSSLKANEINFAEKQNMGYFSVYWRKNTNGFNHDDEAVTTSRYDTYPDWMTHFWSILQNRQLNKIFIPGTHNSACHTGIQVQNPLFKSELAITQDASIKQQLAMGIRYLDISVMRDPQSHEFWVGHNEIPIMKFDDVLKDLIEFVTVTDKEIVILDIHKLSKGFHKNEDHVDFVNYLKSKLTVNGKKLWVPRDEKDKKGKKVWGMTLNEIVSTGGNIIVSYNKRDQQCQSHGGILWYPVKQHWDKKSKKIEDVKSYFDKKFSKKDKLGAKGRAAFPLFTPEDAINLQAQRHAHQIQSWFLEPSYGQYTNILAVDFFRGMGSIRTALLWNERLAQPDKRDCDAQSTVDDWYYQHNILY